MRILVSADLHANIYACENIYKIIKNYNCDLHVTIGDVIDIGPWPKETLDMIIDNKAIHIKGNHEEFHTSLGLSPSLKKKIDKNESEHYCWTRSNLTNKQLEYLENLDHIHEIEVGKSKIIFQHFFLEDGRISEFNPFKKGIENIAFDVVFQRQQEMHSIIMFGHLHTSLDLRFNNRYIGLNSSGCSMKDGQGKIVKLLELKNGKIEISDIALHWDADLVRKEMDRLKVPDRDMLKSLCFT